MGRIGSCVDGVLLGSDSLSGGLNGCGLGVHMLLLGDLLVGHLGTDGVETGFCGQSIRASLVTLSLHGLLELLLSLSLVQAHACVQLFTLSLESFSLVLHEQLQSVLLNLLLHLKGLNQYIS